MKIEAGVEVHLEIPEVDDESVPKVIPIC
jgi:hypothetical protein